MATDHDLTRPFDKRVHTLLASKQDDVLVRPMAASEASTVDVVSEDNSHGCLLCTRVTLLRVSVPDSDPPSDVPEAISSS